MSPPKPVRKIGVQSRSMTGTRPDANRYESALERDFMMLVQGDPDFRSYHAQPIWIDYFNPVTGKDSRYPPDGLVYWKSNRRPMLVEIKYRKDCAGLWRELRAKFRAAKRLADSNGWDFHVITEEQVRSDRLFNVRFLTGYKNRTVSQTIQNAIASALANGPLSIDRISQHLASQGVDAQDAVSACWALVARLELHIDWEVPVNKNTLIWN